MKSNQYLTATKPLPQTKLINYPYNKPLINYDQSNKNKIQNNKLNQYQTRLTGKPIDQYNQQKPYTRNGNNLYLRTDNIQQQKPYYQDRRPNSTKNHDQVQMFKSKGIGLTSKVNRPISITKNKLNEQYTKQTDDYNQYKTNLAPSYSQGKLFSRQSEWNSKLNANQLSQKHLIRDEQGYRKQLSEYQKLHEKLNNLQNKIADMKNNLQKKRAQKEIILDKQQKQRKQRQIQRNDREQQQLRSQQKLTIETGNRTVEKNQFTKVINYKEQPKSKDNNPLKSIVTQVPKQSKQLHNFQFNPYSPRHNLYYVSQITRAYKQQKSLARQHLMTSMQLIRIMELIKKTNINNQQNPQKIGEFEKNPIYKDKKTVVFDLDQTLIHCNQNTNIAYDVKLPIKFPNGQIIEAGINIRPYAFQILKNLSKNFEIIVFTASHSCYANVVLDYLDPEKKYIQHRLFRQHCFPTPQGMYVKDLRVINRNLADMVLVDNAAYSYGFQLQNGIPIIPYYEGKNDYELKALQGYIQSLIWVGDVRQQNKKTFKLHLYRNYDDPEKLVKELYGQWIV